MIEKGKISAFQMGLMMYPTVTATIISLVPSITAKHAGRDMWLSPVWASLVGFLTVYIVCRLNNLFPKETPIQYSQRILGRIPGKVIGLVYLFFYLHITGVIAREFGDFILATFLPLTPQVVIIGIMLLLFGFAVRGGVEVVARSAQIFVPVLLIFTLLIVILLIPDLKVSRMLPVLEKGIGPSLAGAVMPQGWFSEFMLISFLLPFLTDREKGMKWGMISVFSVMVIMVLTNLAVLLLFGNFSGSLIYPLMDASRYVTVADFFEHLEVVVMAVWVGGAYVKLTVFYYALVLGTAQWLNLSDYRPVVLPIGLILVVMGIWAAPSSTELAHFLSASGALYLTSVQTVIPMLLLLIAVVRLGRRGETSN